MSMRLYPTESPIQQAVNLGLVRDLKRDYGASGSAQTTTGSMTAGSNVLTLADPIDFQNGQAVAIVHAGPGPYQIGTTTALSAPTGLSIAPQITNGYSSTPPSATQNYTYHVAALDDRGGITAATSVTTSAATYASLSWVFWLKVSWSAVVGAAGYAVWGDASNPPSSQGWLGITYNTDWVDLGQGPEGNQVSYEASVVYPASPPTAPLGQTLFTSIVSGAGTTSVTLSNSPAQSGTQSVFHDDTIPLSSALGDLKAGAIGTIEIPENTTIYVQGIAQDGLVGKTIRGQNRYTSVIKSLPGVSANTLLLTNPSDVTVADLSIDGNKVNTGYASAGDNEDDSNGLVLRENASYCTVERIEAKNTWMSPLKLGGMQTSYTSTRCKVLDSNVFNGGDQGISMWNSTYNEASDCNIDQGGWAGFSLTQSSFCAVTNVISKYNTYYFNAPNSEGHAFAIEGAHNNTFGDCIGLYSGAWSLHVGVGPFNNLSPSNNTWLGGTLGRSRRTGQGVAAGGCKGFKMVGANIWGNSGEGITGGTDALYESCSISHNGSNAADSGMTDTTFLACLVKGNMSEGIAPYAGGSSYNGNVKILGCAFNWNKNTAVDMQSTQNFTISDNTVECNVTTNFQETLTIQTATNGMVSTFGGTSAEMVGVVLSTIPEGIGAVFLYEDNSGSLGAAIGNLVWNELDEYEVDFPATQNGTTYTVGQSVIAQYISSWDATQIPSANAVSNTHQVGNNGIAVTTSSSVNSSDGVIKNNYVVNSPYQPYLIANLAHSEIAGNRARNCSSNTFDFQGISYCDVHDNEAVDNQNTAFLFENGSAGCTDNRVHDNRAVDDRGASAQMQYGFVESGSANGNDFYNNVIFGNTSSAMTLIGSTSVARNNVGYNPVGALTAPTVGASPWTYTNDNNVRATLYVTGGTVTSIAQYGVTTGLIAGAFALEVGQSVTVTYTAAPTAALIGA